MKKSNLDKTAIDILYNVASTGKIEESYRSYLAIELVRIESQEEIETNILDRIILDIIDTIITSQDCIPNEIKNLINASLLLLRLMDKNIDSKVSVFSLNRDNEFNATINSIYYICQGVTGDNFKIHDELLSHIFYDSDLEYVKAVLEEVHKKLIKK